MEHALHDSLRGSRNSIAERAPQPLCIEVSAGELIDKFTILRIKSRRIADPRKLQHVRTELERLTCAREKHLPAEPQLNPLETELESLNEALWEIESNLRHCEAQADFGPRFLQLARSVYQLNDRRSQIKRTISLLLNSSIVEEKSY